MIKRRYQTGRKAIVTRRDVLWLVLVGVLVAFGATTWRQTYVEAAPAREHQIPAQPDGIGVPELGPRAGAQSSFS